MSIAQELIETAAAADSERARLLVEDMQRPLATIRDVAQNAERSWSGSNIGYHSTVYFANLDPAPPEAQFTPEWGLLDRWPTHQPHRGWCLMDHAAVHNILLGRAGTPDLKKIDNNLASIRTAFSALKERSISLLVAAAAEKSDAFLDRKLAQIEPLSPASASAMARDLLPSGQYWSRDSEAMSQGLRLAPHQTFLAISLSATALTQALETLATATKEAAAHIQRSTRTSGAPKSTGKRVFIGHGRSAVWRELKDFIENRLRLAVDEFNSISVAGISTAERLSTLLDAAAFAFLIMTAEDEQVDGKMRARENVVHEVGLFQGRIGFRRAIVLIEEGCEEFSNIHGLGQIRFPKGNISAKFEEIRAVLERENVI